jgi:hypothetical protein
MARPVGRNRWWTRDRFRDVINAEHMLRQRVGVQSDCGVDERIAVILHEGQSNGNIGVGKLIMEDRRETVVAGRLVVTQACKIRIWNGRDAEMRR